MSPDDDDTVRAARPFISVIIPVFNTEEWIEECLSSLTRQTFRDWEAIVIIDGSPDASRDRAQAMALHDSRITVIVTPNRGLGAARNEGTRRARGEWVTYLDSDDLLPDDALGSLAGAVRDDVDIVIGSGEDLYGDRRRTRYWTQRSGLHRRGTERTSLELSPDLVNDHVAWAKLYRLTLLTRRGISFSEGVHCEDLVHWAASSALAVGIAVVSDVVYVHRRHDGAISSDNLRVKTLADWGTEIVRALDTTRRLNDTVFDHHVSVVLRRQWSKRVIEIARDGDAERLLHMQRVSAELARRCSPAVMQRLPALEQALLQIAPNALASLWCVSESERMARGGSATTRAERMTEMIEALDLRTVDHARLAAALVLHSLSLDIATEIVALGDNDRVAQRLRSLLQQVQAAATRHDVEWPIDLIDPADPLRALSLRGEEWTATIEGVRPLATSLWIHGRLNGQLITDAVESFELLVREYPSAQPRAHPCWWEVSGDAVVWSATLQAPSPGEHQARAWARVRREKGPIRSVAVSMGDLATTTSSTSIVAEPADGGQIAWRPA